MKNKIILILTQLILALISGIMMSKMSMIGKVGISLVYREYAILKNWWQTALVIFAIMMLLNLLFFLFQKLVGFRMSKILNIIFIVIGLCGFAYTIHDFNFTSHKHMKISFHIGGYLFWLNWMLSCFYYLLMKKNFVLNKN